MICSQIGLFQFKNYDFQKFDCNASVVAISGQNGKGKTNLLDAIYYSAFTKSAFTHIDQNLVKQGSQGFRVEAQWQTLTNKYDIKAIVRENGKKEFYCNESLYQSLSQHIGLVSVVLITPDDIALINEDSGFRRKFIDAILSQTNANYLHHFLLYNKLLLQRRALLKNLQENRSNNYALLDVLDEQIAPSGDFIFEARKAFLETFIPSIMKQYALIAMQNQEQLTIKYETALSQTNTLNLLQQFRAQDIKSGRNNVGIHKDDLVFGFGNMPFKQIASQGQKKSMLIACKMAEFLHISTLKNDYPILMIDDVFEKLDGERLYNLMQLLPKDENFQLFTTDTSEERLVHLLKETNKDFISLAIK
jgi:DNA replication and repair protein RecF